MKNKYFFILFFLINSIPNGFSQACDSLTASATGFESFCTATGSIKINASGGSGNYKYKVTGPTNTNFTSVDSITGLSAGNYTVIVNDLANNCSFSLSDVEVTGSYQDPRFILDKVDVSCDNGSNGSISIAGLQNGLSPFVYSIAAPSTMGVGKTNTTGHFENLSAGTYYIRLSDSCGGIQTRQVTVNNYTWSLNAYPFTKTSCTDITGYILATDSYGNTSTGSGIPGFSYGIILSPGDTTWQSSPNFSLSSSTAGSFEVLAKDNCGNIKTGIAIVNPTPQVDSTLLFSNMTCVSFSASITGIVNFISARFCLYDSTDVEISCNTTGSFENLAYNANYCITAYDSCTSSTIKRCFVLGPPPLTVANNVQVTNKTCNDFTAAITGQTGLTDPEYCLYNNFDSVITCNTNGIFYSLPYGDYCIAIKDACRDTVLYRCFNASKPQPILNAIAPAYNNCSTFGVVISGDSLFYPQYCITDTTGIIILCNSTGVFDSIPLGDYCVSVYDSCYDTTLTRCFTVGMPVINNDLSANISNRTCTTFTAAASGASLTNAEYCLYTASNSLVACNYTGVFNNLPYGDYCVRAHNLCPDTVMTFCFSARQLVPQMNEAVGFSDENCNTFTASIRDQRNFTNPIFCIYDSANNLLGCNNTGTFGRLLFGRYCITARDECYDSTITRCFERFKQDMDIVAWPGPSCSIGYAHIYVATTNAVFPVNVTILKPDGSYLKMERFVSPDILVDSLPGIDTGKFYTIIAEDACGKRDTATAGGEASFFRHATQILLKCPGASWASGSGNIKLQATTNKGVITARVIKKDNVTYSNPLLPDSEIGDEFFFNDLGPGTYIIKSFENICYRTFYDTVTINPYLFPNLNNSTAYLCDQGGFSVGAVASNGVSPYTFEIIGSTPAGPAIVTPPQTSPLFTVNNGTSYSLVRLRALDACGNATLSDASILPLAINGISASNRCMWSPASLSVDALYNASYNWYKKDSLYARDSVFLGSTPSYDIPSVTPADTGTYICYLQVNEGCISRQYNFRLNGDCDYYVLPVSLKEFKGRQENGKNILMWMTSSEEGVDQYIIERQTATGVFKMIQQLPARNKSGLQQYQLTDDLPIAGNNFYRLKILSRNGSVKISNTILLQNKIQSFTYSVYPNPVKDHLNIKLVNSGTKTYQVRLYNMMNQLTWQKTAKGNGTTTLQFARPGTVQPGIYLLRIITDNEEQVTEKLIFL